MVSSSPTENQQLQLLRKCVLSFFLDSVLVGMSHRGYADWIEGINVLVLKLGLAQSPFFFFPQVLTSHSGSEEGLEDAAMVTSILPNGTLGPGHLFCWH